MREREISKNTATSNAIRNFRADRSFLLGALFGAACLNILLTSTTVQEVSPAVDGEEKGHDGNGNGNDSNGWNQIDVFYGDRTGMLQTTQNKWFSQVGQDQEVHKLLGNLEEGYFVDLASNDATMISNSYALETFHGWNGLCIEANAKYWARLAFRKCKVIGAVVGKTRMEEVEFNFGSKAQSNVIYHHQKYDSGAMGGIVGNDMDNKKHKVNAERQNLVKRYTVPLEEIFQRHDAPKTIDYFSLDVEGAESMIMLGFPFQKYKFRILSIERPKDDLRQLLQSNNYTYVQNLGKFGETIWAHASEMNRINALRAQ
jgi:hypothetical protein